MPGLSEKLTSSSSSSLLKQEKEKKNQGEKKKMKDVSVILPTQGYSHQKKDYQEKNNEHYMYYLLF